MSIWYIVQMIADCCASWQWC